MVKDENKLFLKEYYNIDVDNYSAQSLNLLLDTLNNVLEETIDKMKINNFSLMKNILLESISIENDI